MGINKKLGLPFGEMKKIVIAVDVDGTLITNTGARPDIANEKIVELVKTLSSFKNVRIVVWSGGGNEVIKRWFN